MRRNLPSPAARGSTPRAARALRRALLPAALALGCAPPEEPPGTGSTPAAATDTVAPRETGPGESPDAAALRELSERFARGLRAGDPDTVASVYSRAAEVFAPGQPELLLGQAAVRDHYARWLEGRALERFDVRRSDPVVRSDVAYSFGVWTALVRPPDGSPPVELNGWITDVYRREGAGPWVVAHEHASVVPSPEAPPDTAGTGGGSRGADTAR